MFDTGRPMRHRWLMVLVAALALGACAQSSNVSYVDISPYYRPSLVSWMTVDGKIPAEIHGQPFPTGQVEPEAIAASIAGPAFASPTRLTTDPAAAEARGGHRIVLLFNPEGAPKFRQICADAATIKRTPPGEQTITHAALCAREEIVTTAVVKSKTASNTEDPLFQSAMSQLIANLLPAFDPTAQQGFGFGPRMRRRK